MYLLFLILGVQVPSLGSEVDHLELLLGLFSSSLSDPGLVRQNRPRPLPSTSYKIQYYLFILPFLATNQNVCVNQVSGTANLCKATRFEEKNPTNSYITVNCFMMQLSVLYFVDRASRHKFLLIITNLMHFFMYLFIHFISLHVSSIKCSSSGDRIVLIQHLV